jgi:alanine racemase
MSGNSSSDKTSGPWVDINLGAIATNYATLRAAAPDAEMAAVVKCNAYGLGLAPIAKTLAEQNCKTFFVAYPQEGAALRDVLKPLNADAAIYVFNGPLPQTMALFQSAKLTPVLNSLEQATTWAAQSDGAPAALHIDTGMNRLGAPLSEVDAIAALSGLNINLVMSHLACATDPAHPKNDEQCNLFASIAKDFPHARASLSASGGALMDARFHFDLVRPGVALYGGSPFDVDEPRLKPVAVLRAPVVQIRNIAPGETVGYNASFKATAPTRLATVALGYGDGMPTSGSSTAQAMIAGGRARIAGRISMDLISLDITNHKNSIKTGDIATFFGEEISLFEAAKSCNTSAYELLTGLGGRVDRRYL